MARSPARYPEAFPLWNSPHSPCGRGSHAKDMGTLVVSVGLRLLSMGFRGICSVPSAIPRPIDNASRPASLLKDILYRSPVPPEFPLLFLGGGRGRGGRATAKTNDYYQCSGAGFAVKWSRQHRAGFYPVPRCRRRNDTTKILSVKGFRVEILRQQNTTRPLPGWIGVAVIMHFLLHVRWIKRINPCLVLE